MYDISLKYVRMDMVISYKLSYSVYSRA